MDKYPLHRTGATGYNGTGEGTRYERSTVYPLPRSKGKEGEGEMRELKKCPFCGAVAEMQITKHIPSGNDYTPRCTNTSCCGRLSKKYTLRETAVTMWNTRTHQNDEVR